MLRREKTIKIQSMENINWQAECEKSHGRAWATLKQHFGSIIGPMPGMCWNRRLRTTAGRAQLEEGVIELASKVFEQHPEGFILDIIPHELAHIAAWRAAKDNGHGKFWNGAMDALSIMRKDRRTWSMASMLECRVRFYMQRGTK